LWLIIAGLGGAVVAIEVFVAKDGPLRWGFLALGAGALLLGLVRYRSLRAHHHHRH
jgi:hypothetical protein